MKVLFVCVQGLSSAIVVSSLKKQAKKENIDMDILAVSIREFEKEIENGCNLAVIAPQVMHKYDYLSKISNERGIPCVLVDKDIYGPRSGMKLLNMVIKAIGWMMYLQGINMRRSMHIYWYEKVFFSC